MKSRKAMVRWLGALLFVTVLAVPASATVCVNVSKADGAGNIGDVIIRLDGSVSEPENRGDQLAGGFVDVYVEFDANGDGVADGTIKILDDTYILSVKHAMAAGLPLPELPEGAHLAAGCGVAVDDAIVCSLP